MSTPIVVAGMHRSGTSLLASLLREAGVHFGDRFSQATEFNARGNLEDLDFVDLHDAMLRDNGTDAHLSGATTSFSVDESRRTTAEELVAARSGRPQWGWKDPRTTLFLDHWSELLPDAKFVFIFRSPEQVIGSLQRRGDPQLTMYRGPGREALRRLGFRFFRLEQALDMWLAYNRRVLEFNEAHPERSCVVSQADLPQVFPTLLSVMGTSWNVDLQTPDPARVYEPSLLHSLVHESVLTRCRKRRELQELFTSLEARALRAEGS